MANTVNLKDAVKNKQEIQIVDREDKFYLRYQMYKGNYYAQTKHRLKQIYSKVEDIKLDKQINNTNNVFNSVIEKISRVYSFGVERIFEDEKLEQIFNDIEASDYMEEANKYYNAFNDILLQVSWNKEKNQPTLRFRYPHNLQVHTDENDNLIALEYQVKSKDDNIKTAYWSKTETYYKVYDNKGGFEKEPIVGNEDMVNPYGRLPFVVMQKGFRDYEFFDEYSGDDLVNITLDNAVYNTFKNYLIKWQSFKQLVISGSSIQGIDGQMLDPSTALTVNGDEAKVDLLDLQANLTELSKTLNESVDSVARNYKISPSSFNLSSQATSGFSKAMENASLDEFTRKQQKSFLRYEYNLIDLIVHIAEVEGVSLNKSVSIDIKQPFYPESRGTVADTDKKEIDLGLTNQIEIIMQRRGVTKDEAQEIYNENIKVRNQANTRFDVSPSANIPITEGS